VNQGCLRRRLRYRAAGIIWGLGMRDDAAFFVWGGLATRTGPVGTCHPCQRCACHVVVGLATSSMSTLCSPCCRWTCPIIHVNVVLATLSLDLPHHPRQCCTRRVVIGLATSSLGYPHRRWACWLSLGFAQVEGREKGLAAVVEGNANMTYLTVSHNMGLPLHFHNPLHPPIILHQR